MRGCPAIWMLASVFGATAGRTRRATVADVKRPWSFEQCCPRADVYTDSDLYTQPADRPDAHTHQRHEPPVGLMQWCLAQCEAGTDPDESSESHPNGPYGQCD